MPHRSLHAAQPHLVIAAHRLRRAIAGAAAAGAGLRAPCQPGGAIERSPGAKKPMLANPSGWQPRAEHLFLAVAKLVERHTRRLIVFVQ